MSSPGAIYKNLIFTGTTPGRAREGTSATVRAWDVTQDKLSERSTPSRPARRTTRVAGKTSGPIVRRHVWRFMTVDVQQWMLLWRWARATRFFTREWKGSNLYGSSLVALDAGTGQLKW